MEKNSRRIAERPDFANRRDYMEYMMTINQDNATKKKNAEYMSRTGTFCKFNGSYFDESDTTVSPMKH